MTYGEFNNADAFLEKNQLKREYIERGVSIGIQIHMKNYRL